MAVELNEQEGVAVITMVDDGKRNTLSSSHVKQMLHAIDQSRNARAIVIAARGKVFCAGADIGGVAGGKAETTTFEESGELVSGAMTLFKTLLAEKRLVIAAVHGGAFGGGFEMTLCCDLVIASTEAFFVLPEVGFGALPPIAMARLPRLIGARRTLELVVMRRKLTAPEANALGLVSRIVPAEELVGGAVALAREAVGSAPPGAIAAVKAGLAEDAEDIAQATKRYTSRLVEAEWREGFASFLEKRPLDFSRFWNSK